MIPQYGDLVRLKEGGGSGKVVGTLTHLDQECARVYWGTSDRRDYTTLVPVADLEVVETAVQHALRQVAQKDMVIG